MAPWRFVCPQGHHSIQTRTRIGGWFCEVCRRRYTRRVDKLTGQIEVDPSAKEVSA